MLKLQPMRVVLAFALMAVVGSASQAWGRVSLAACGTLLSRTVRSFSLQNKTREELIEQYKELLPTARGAVDAGRGQILRAHEAIQQIGEYIGSYPERTESPTPRTDDTDILLHEPIAKIKEFKSTGLNKAYLVEFTNGHMAVFKPFLGQRNFLSPSPLWRHRIAFPRETSAVGIIEDFLGNARSRAQGLSSLEVPATEEVLLVHKGVSYGVGSIMAYIDGVKCSENTIKRRDLEERIRTIDYLLGNPDRLNHFDFGIFHYESPNFDNILLDRLTGKRTFLIDNAFGRPGPPGFMSAYAPPPAKIPKDLAAAILSFDGPRFKRTYASVLPPEGIADFINRIRTLQKELGH